MYINNQYAQHRVLNDLTFFTDQLSGETYSFSNKFHVCLHGLGGYAVSTERQMFIVCRQGTAIINHISLICARGY